MSSPIALSRKPGATWPEAISVAISLNKLPSSSTKVNTSTVISRVANVSRVK